MANSSALVGSPPATQDDYWIVRSLLLVAGIPNPDPSKGAKIPPARPPPERYHFETNGPRIIAGSAVSLVVMALFTGTRLLLRSQKAGLKFGLDDWFIIPGAVCQPRKTYVGEFRELIIRRRYLLLYGQFFRSRWCNMGAQAGTSMISRIMSSTLLTGYSTCLSWVHCSGN
jgi:hypothetical protein